MWIPRHRWALAVVFLLAGCCARVVPPAQKQENDGDPEPAVAVDPAAHARAVEAVKKLGGSVDTIDNKRGIGAGVRATFVRVPLRDDDLAALAGLTALRELTIDDTPITGVGLKHLAGLSRVRKLEVIAGRALTDAGFRELARLAQVRSLDLTFTAVSEKRLKLLAEMTALRELRICPERPEPGAAPGEPVTVAGLKAVTRLTNLRVLVLTRVPVNDETVIDLAALPELREVDLSETEITDAALKSLASCRKLHKLGVIAPKVTGMGLGQLAELPELRRLAIHVTAAGQQELPRLTQLEELRVDGGELTDDAVRSLGALKGLRTLVIQGAVYGAIRAGAQDLGQKLPGCTITLE
jgi:hypothetical protein